ncbi:MAG: type 4a pilus biogenesis protein PilO [bacterium]|nr:type 4a pilus biogenesis protein PilO [bacterium]
MLEKNLDKEIEIRSRSNIGTLIGLFIVVASVVLYVFLAGPVATEADTIKADISTKSAELVVLKEKVASFEKSQEDLELTTEVQRLEILKAVPLEMDQDEVIRDVIEISDTYDVKLKSISFGKGSSRYEGVGSLRINASFEGNYTDLTDFLQGLEQNARMFKIDSISVQINKLDITDIERANFSLVIESFYQQ